MSPAQAIEGDSTSLLLAEWTSWQRAGNLRERTVAERQNVVRRMEGAAGDSLSCDWQALTAYFADLHERASAGTAVTYFTHLMCWFAWLQIMGYRPDNPMKRLHRPRAPRRYARPLSNEQMQHLFDTGRFYRRTRTMILLAAYQGLRAHEIAAVRGEDFSSHDFKIEGKGGVIAYLPIHPLIQAEREKYPPSGWWFPRHDAASDHVEAKSVSTTVSNALRRADIDATCHQLRHYYATEVHKATGDLRVTQELMRHASPATTALYTRVDADRVRAALMGMRTHER